MTIVAAAAMITTGMSFPVVVMVFSVVIALDVGVEPEFTFRQSLGRCICTSGNAPWQAVFLEHSTKQLFTE